MTVALKRLRKKQAKNKLKIGGKLDVFITTEYVKDKIGYIWRISTHSYGWAMSTSKRFSRSSSIKTQGRVTTQVAAIAAVHACYKGIETPATKYYTLPVKSKSVFLTPLIPLKVPSERCFQYKQEIFSELIQRLGDYTGLPKDFSKDSSLTTRHGTPVVLPKVSKVYGKNPMKSDPVISTKSKPVDFDPFLVVGSNPQTVNRTVRIEQLKKRESSSPPLLLSMDIAQGDIFVWDESHSLKKD